MLLDFNGDVLIEGGQDANGNDLDTAEEFDPTTGTFTTLTAQMITAAQRPSRSDPALQRQGVDRGRRQRRRAGRRDRTLRSCRPATFVDNGEMNTARDEFAANFFALPAVGQVLMSGGMDSTGTPLALAETFSYQTIRTDQPDYPPGSDVIINGAGFAPIEKVTTVIEGSNGENDVETDNADSTGSFTDYNFTIADTDGGVTFVMTATGQTSGLTAQYRFTDHVTGVALTAQSPTSIPAGGTGASTGATYTATCTANSNTVTYSLVNPAGSAANPGSPGTAWTLAAWRDCGVHSDGVTYALVVTCTTHHHPHRGRQQHYCGNVSTFTCRGGIEQLVTVTLSNAAWS